jgi:hypothetical protein
VDIDEPPAVVPRATGIGAVAFSNDDRRLFSASLHPFPGEGTFWIHDVDDLGTPLLTRTETDRVGAAAFSPDDTMVATAGTSSIDLWDAETGQRLRSFGPHPEGPWRLTFNARGDLLATADYKGLIKIWDVSSGGERLSLENHRLGIGSIQFPMSGRTLVSSSFDGDVRVWDLSTGRTPDVLGWQLGASECGDSRGGSRQTVRVRDRRAAAHLDRCVARRSAIGEFAATPTIVASRADGRVILRSSGFSHPGDAVHSATRWQVRAADTDWSSVYRDDRSTTSLRVLDLPERYFDPRRADRYAVQRGSHRRPRRNAAAS